MAATYEQIAGAQTRNGNRPVKARASIKGRDPRYTQVQKTVKAAGGVPVITDEYDEEGPASSAIRARRSAQPTTNPPVKRDYITDEPQQVQGTRQRAGARRKGNTFLAWLKWTGILVGLYTLLFWIVFGAISLYNLCAYGPTHTINTDITIGGQPAHVTAVNASGTIYITIYQRQANGKTTSQSYQGPQLDPNYWGDMGGIVVTMDQPTEKGNVVPTLTFHLQGNPDPWHLIFIRPHSSFQLVPTSNGYVVN